LNDDVILAHLNLPRLAAAACARAKDALHSSGFSPVVSLALSLVANCGALLPHEQAMRIGPDCLEVAKAWICFGIETGAEVVSVSLEVLEVFIGHAPAVKVNEYLSICATHVAEQPVSVRVAIGGLAGACGPLYTEQTLEEEYTRHLCTIFHVLLVDKISVVQYAALTQFQRFAAVTPHVTMVDRLIPPSARLTVVGFLKREVPPDGVSPFPDIIPDSKLSLGLVALEPLSARKRKTPESPMRQTDCSMDKTLHDLDAAIDRTIRELNQASPRTRSRGALRAQKAANDLAHKLQACWDS